MAKKQQVPKNIESKFNKPQYRIGDAVFFLWLGQKKYGHVIRTKQTGWGIQYTVETNNKMRYPCGIQIGQYKTTYYTGCIDSDITKSFDRTELEHRIATASDTRAVKPVSTNTGRATDVRGIDSESNKQSDADTGRKTSKPRSKSNGRKNDDKSSSAGVRGKTTKSRKGSANPELDSAIEKQRNFLNGFVKKD